MPTVYRSELRDVIMVLLFLGLAILPSSALAQSAQTGHKSVVAPSRAATALGPLLNIPQTLNNCGPASVAEVLAYWHVMRTQEQVQAVLRADHNSWGMAPYGVPAYARSLGLQGMIGVAGTERLVKALLSNRFPVIVSQLVSPTFRVRHYRPIEAYDDRRRIFVASDPYLGPGHSITYTDFASLWSVSDDRFLVIYPASRAALLQAVLTSAGWNRISAYRQDLAWQQARLRKPQQNDSEIPVPLMVYPALAWDEAQLHQFGAARQALRQAKMRGVNPVLLRWIDQEIQRLQRTRGSK